MKPRFRATVAALFLLVLGSSGVAQADAPATYRVSIPKSRIEYPVSGPLSPAPQEKLDFGASSWVPSGFALPGRVNATQTFSRASVPSFYFNYLRAFSPDLFAKAGFNWLALSRNSSIGDQTVQLVSIRLGGEYAPQSLKTRFFSPYLGVAAMPSFGLAGRSVYTDGDIYFGVPLEASLGIQAPLSALGMHWPGTELNLGAVGTTGTVNHSSVAGLGVQGGIRMDL
jgi:hypothetical protein